MNLIILQSTAMLRVQIAQQHWYISLLVSYKRWVPAYGRLHFGDFPDQLTCDRQVELILIEYCCLATCRCTTNVNYSWHRHIALLVSYVKVYRQMKDGKRPADRRDVSRRIWLEAPSIENYHLVIYCCTANMNYSQLWHITLVVSWMEVSSDILIRRQRDKAADDQEIRVITPPYWI